METTQNSTSSEDLVSDMYGRRAKPDRNVTISILKNHRSERSYVDWEVDADDLDAVIEAGRRAPTSINGQQVSLVVTREQSRRDRIAAIAGGQAWISQAPVFITLVMDFNKTRIGVEKAGASQVIHRSVEALVAGVTDVGIAMGSMIVAAHSLGLGVVPIGGIRNDPDAMIDLLDLPKLTFPVAGLVIGHVDAPSSARPRLPISTFRHTERYRSDGLSEAIDLYDKTMREHWRAQHRLNGEDYSHNTRSYYERIYFPDVVSALIEQGFGLDK